MHFLQHLVPHLDLKENGGLGKETGGVLIMMWYEGGGGIKCFDWLESTPPSISGSLCSQIPLSDSSINTYIHRMITSISANHNKSVNINKSKRKLNSSSQKITSINEK